MKKIETLEEALWVAIGIFTSVMTDEQLEEVNRRFETLNLKVDELLEIYEIDSDRR